MPIKDSMFRHDDEKDPQTCSKEWPWSLPRSVMRARYGQSVGEISHAKEPEKGSSRPLRECDPVPIYLAEMKKLGKLPDKQMLETLEKLWATYRRRNLMGL